MKTPAAVGLLVRVPTGQDRALAAAAGSTITIKGAKLELQPLFSTGGAAEGLGVAASAPTAEWHVARLDAGVEEVNPWDLAHAAAGPGLGMAPGGVLIEPDLEQGWVYQNPRESTGEALAAAADACQFNDQIAKLPGFPGRFAWHLDDPCSQLRRARELVGEPAAKIRIGHLDTGYDPEQVTLPKHFRKDLGRNFVDDQAADDTHDPAKRGTLQNPGHGTGTLGLLAGNRVQFSAPGYANFNDFVGGAPEAEVIPLRVGTSVVQFRTSSVAAALNYAIELSRNPATAIHVLSMSMGGVASQAWADAVNQLYEAGIVYVAAAGNNFSAGLFGVPTRLIVYPARFRRVIAACGVMANGSPYFGLPAGTMQGNWGPASKMATALSAFTPNTSWAELGCSKIVDMDGSGTSSATPQIAAAAALYFQHHAAELFDKGRYPEPWMRAEAVRQALFSGASRAGDMEKLGNGILQAAQSLRLAPQAANALHQAPRDSATLSLLNVFTGFGAVAQDDAKTRMLALEATQLAQQWPINDRPNPFDRPGTDPDLPPEAISPADRRELLAALRDHPRASRPLRARLEEMLGARAAAGPAKKALPVRKTKTPAEAAAQAPDAPPRRKPPFIPPRPAHRRLRGFALDPSLSTVLETSPISRTTFEIPWEPLKPGPVGEYLEVVDIDPASGCTYEPIDLDRPELLAQNGLEPSEGTPQFHQQMVYAVASLTIANFEHALGRRTLWRPGPSPDKDQPKNDSVFVPRLRIYPHALRERNAYYSPKKMALLLGYFRAAGTAPGDHRAQDHMSGGMVFTALSHDVIAHETTHALLDGMNRAYLAPTNPDVHAFHEAFADIVALFQHFTFPEILRHQISRTRGELRSQRNMLGELAAEFGRGTGTRCALRDYIGTTVDGKWTPREPDPVDYQTITEPHERGAILVATVFDAFLAIYETRTADLVRLAAQGGAVPAAGAIHPDLVARLAEEAAKAAQHVVTMCIRAIDYCPIVDITFGEFLRAVITADYDLVANDDLNYRVAFIEAFRKRGIYPRDIRTLSVESLLWNGREGEELFPSSHLEAGLMQARSFVDTFAYTNSREQLFQIQREMRRRTHEWLAHHFANETTGHADARYLGLDPRPDARRRGSFSFEVRSARLAFRTSPDGGLLPQLVVSVLQRKEAPGDPLGTFEGGATVVADLRSGKIKYCIRKSSASDSRQDRQRAFALQAGETLSGVYFNRLNQSKPGAPDGGPLEPFALLHRGA